MRSRPDFFRPWRIALALVAASPSLLAQHFPGELYDGLTSGSAVATADLDGNGTVDAVLSGPATSSLAVFPGNGKGGFTPPHFVPCGLGARSVVVGDATGDGKADLVVANHAFNVVGVMAGDGVGGFAAPLFIPLGADPTLVRLADLDLDGVLDVVALLPTSDRVAIRFGPATPLVVVPQYLATGDVPGGLAIGDLDGDGLPDIAVAQSTPNSVAVFSGNGAGAFSAPNVVSVPSVALIDIAAGDLNGDGALDLAVVGSDTGCKILLGAPPGFAPPSPVAVSGFTSVSLQDWNGDGKLDLLGTTTSTSVVAVSGVGDGSFGASKTLTTTLQPVGIAPRDLDGDGDLDLTVAGNFGTLGVILNEGGGTVSTQTISPAVGGTGAWILTGDFDGNGIADVVVPLSSTSVFLHGPSGYTTPSAVLTTSSATRAAAADANHDGALDLAVQGNILKFFAGNGNGTFAAASTISATDFATDLTFLDATDDGNADLASIEGLTFRVRVGDGQGAFASPLSKSLPALASSLAYGDIDRDGHVDVVVTYPGFANLTFFFGDGQGDFTSTNLAVPLQASRAVLCDVNADGLLDLATIHPNGTALRIGNGAGQFAAPVTFGSGCLPTAIAVSDVDGDGNLDYVAGASCTGSDVVVTFGNAGGLPTTRVIVSTSYTSTTSIALADIDGDGSPEVFAGHGHDVTVLPNLRVSPGGVVPFGTGTPGCMGTVGMSANGTATLGNSAFGLLSTNAPPNALGLGLRTDVSIPAGAETFAFGLLFHVDLLGSSDVYGFDMFSDAGGSAFGGSPIPNQPGFSGATIYFQTLWLPPAFSSCSDAVLGLISSRGLAVTIQ